MLAQIHMKQNNSITILNVNHIIPGMIYRKLRFKGGYHPPKKNITAIALMRIMLAYSPKKNRANGIDEYSTLCSDTTLDSAYSKSKGCLLVPAKTYIKDTHAIGNNNKSIQYGILCRATTISPNLRDPVTNSTVTIVRPIDTSYDIICDADLIAPKNA